MADLTGMLQAAAGAGGAAEGAYIEDVFSTYLYTGTGSTQTITNGIDLDGEGGLVWTKDRTYATSHCLVDTERGTLNSLFSNNTDAANTVFNTITAFNSDGFNVGTSSLTAGLGDSATTSWTFRKAPKFFDIVTYTGTGVARTVAHNLGSVPGCIMVKRTDTTGDWQVYHRANTANPETDYLVLNSTAATVDSNTRWNDTLPTSTSFTVGTEATVNANTGTYVAYLFAHDANGFGDTGTENVISCGSGTFSAGQEINLGWEPQWLLVKTTSTTADWYIIDNMRGWLANGNATWLVPNSSVSDSGIASFGFELTSTGFKANSGGGSTYIYIAIRRGPMKTPESGTEVFQPAFKNASAPRYSAPFVVDAGTDFSRSFTARFLSSRLTGTGRMETDSNAAEGTDADTEWDYMDGWQGGSGSATTDSVSWQFVRAPGFFDVVCYTGNGALSHTINHNLTVAPELVLIKTRSTTGSWYVGALFGDTSFNQLLLNSNGSATTRSYQTHGIYEKPTSTEFVVGGNNSFTNLSGVTHVAYLFASLAGVSKVGSYTGNGTSVSVTTGFQPRFILVRRTDDTGNWIVGDSARGLVAGDDPFLLLNSDAAETTNQDWVDISATGFTINETAANANVNTGIYLYLAIS